jgi:predicted PurR-regulated permease PerM
MNSIKKPNGPFRRLIKNTFKIKINALFTIMSVIIGDAVWGVPGMFLALPVVAILKILFDSTGHLPPWGLLVGDEIISSHKKQKP